MRLEGEGDLHWWTRLIRSDNFALKQCKWGKWYEPGVAREEVTLLVCFFQSEIEKKKKTTEIEIEIIYFWDKY